MTGKVFGSVTREALPDALRIFDPEEIAFWCGLPDAETLTENDAVSLSEGKSRLLVACAGVARLAAEAAQQTELDATDLAHRRLGQVRNGRETTHLCDRLDVLTDVMRLLSLQVNREPTFDKETVEVFTEGDCHHLAGALHALTGAPICAFLHFGVPGVHVFVQLPDGRFLDVTGPVEPEMMCSQWNVRQVTYTRWPVPEWPSDPYYAEQDLIAEVASVLAGRYMPTLAA